MKNTWLNDFARNNTYSQFGEDGIIGAILDQLPQRDSWCVEFGAWDGKHLSTTLLLREQGYSAVLIEGETKKFKQLHALCAREKNSIAVNSYVSSSGENSLDRILSRTPIPKSFDLLVIDVDGNDYYIWKHFVNYRPKVVCIECNPSFPDDALFIQNDGEDYQGSSMQAMVDLASDKGYKLVATLGGNTFFVDEPYYSLFGIEDNSLHSLRSWYGSIMQVAQTYKGELFVYGAKQLIWTSDKLVTAEMQLFDRRCRALLNLSAQRKRLFEYISWLRDKILGF